MQQKIRRALQNESGLSIIIVLCIGALFVALSAAVLYAASTLVASANRVLPREDTYQMARSFAEKVEAELTSDKDSALKTFVMNTFVGVDKGSISTYDPESKGVSYDFLRTDGSDPAVTITLKKEKVDGVEITGDEKSLNAAAFTKDNTAQSLNDFETKLQAEGGVNDYLVTVTVTVENGGTSYAFTQKYERYIGVAARYKQNGVVYLRNTEGSGTENQSTTFTKLGGNNTISLSNATEENPITGYLIYDVSAEKVPSFKLEGGDGNA